MTSASQLQEIEETISNVASQQGNDSYSSYVDVNDVGDDDDVTGAADCTASSEQQPKRTVKSSDNFLLMKIAALEHKVHFILSFLGIDDFRHNTALTEAANINSFDHELRSIPPTVGDHGGVKTFKGPSFSDVVSDSLFTNVQTKSSKSVQGQQHWQQVQHQGQPIRSKSDSSVVRASMQAPVLNPQLRNAVLSVVQKERSRSGARTLLSDVCKHRPLVTTPC